MRPLAPRFALPCLALALLLASCAGPAKLAQQSDEALAKGDLHKAYDRALKAIEKDPQNQAARSAYSAASERIAADERGRVLALAAADTLAAADLALDLHQFRLEVARHQTALAPADSYDASEHTILASAAHTHYALGREAMRAHRPKAAYLEFTACRRYDDAYADVAARQDAALRAATTRVLLLPFVNDVGITGLSQEIAGKVQSEIASHAGKSLPFTQVVDAASLAQKMTVAQARDLQREDALKLAHQLGAERVVYGRFHGLRTDNSEREAVLPLFHRFDEKDAQGASHTRWAEGTIRIVTRERQVEVTCTFDVLNADDGTVLVHHEDPLHEYARTAWTDFRPAKDEDLSHYTLLPPDVRNGDPDRAKSVDAQWHDHMGSWQLNDLLRQARDHRDREHYASRWRDEFHGDTRQHPVWMGELPGTDDLTTIALGDTWQGVLAELRKLDAQD